VLTTIVQLLLIFCFSHKVYAGKSITKPALKTSSMTIHLNEISGWNHLKTDVKVQKTMNIPPADYKIVTTQVIDNNKSSINVSTVLVRKIANWHQQHTNGIKIGLVERELSFAQLKGFNFAFTINHLNSVLPSINQGQDFYLKEIKAVNIK